MDKIQNSGRIYGGSSYEGALAKILAWILETTIKATNEGKEIQSMSHSITHYSGHKGGTQIDGYEGSAIIVLK